MGIGNIEFEPGVLEIMSFVDEVFAELGQPPILENPHFMIDKEWAFQGLFPSMICFISKDCDERLRVNLEISSGGLSLNIDRSNEFPEYGYQFIFDNKELVKQQLMMIFGMPIVLIHKGNRTRFMIFKPDGELYGVWTCCEGLSFSALYRKSYTRILKPFFEVG